MTERLKKRDIIAWAVLLGLVYFLFNGTLAGLFDRWWHDPTYSHGILVPAVTLFFLYDRREKFRKIAWKGSLWGMPALLGALALFFIGRLGSMLFVQAIALIGTLAALSLLVGGWRFLKIAAFPILFLVFMCPLPSSIYDPVSAHLRLFASNVATVLLQLLGVTATSTGNIIYLPGVTPLSVEDACSGIRSLFGITATATAFAFIMPGGIPRKTVFIISAAPIAVASNILRVTGTGLLYRYAGGGFAEGFYHSLEGWVFYVVALGALFGEFFLFKVVFPTGGQADYGEEDPAGKKGAPQPGQEDDK